MFYRKKSPKIHSLNIKEGWNQSPMKLIALNRNDIDLILWVLYVWIMKEMLPLVCPVVALYSNNQEELDRYLILYRIVTE